MIRDLIALPDTSKVWVYQSNKEFGDDIREQIRDQVRGFVHEWTSHQSPVEAYGNVFHRQFIVLVANEEKGAVSGCSIDGSVNLIRNIAASYNLDFFDRNIFSYMTEDKQIKTVTMSDLPEAYKNGIVTDETLFFNNLVKNKDQFLLDWIVPLKSSWHYRFV